MIVRIIPTKVSEFWDLIKPALIQQGAFLAPGNWEVSNNTFKQCLAGTIQIWLCTDEEGFKGGILTQLSVNELTQARVLTIALVHFYKPPLMSLVNEARQAMIDFAISNNCTDISFQTRRKGMKELLEKWWPAAWQRVTTFTLKIKPGDANG